MSDDPILRIPAVIESPVFVRAWCALEHSWVSTMVRRLERVEPRQPKALLTVIAAPHCPNCGRPWTRCTETRHG